MRVKGIEDENFVNYKKPSMYIGAAQCDFKCCREGNFPIDTCINYGISRQPTKNISVAALYDRFAENPITEAIVFGGLEPMLQIDELMEFIEYVRIDKNNKTTDIVIYTGYTEHETQEQVDKLKQYDNIIVKFGRYRPDLPECFDDVLGVTLASQNQYARRIS